MNKTSRPGLLIVALLCGGADCATTQKPLPPPPSVALHPSPKPPGEEVRVLVDVIPANAKYVNYAQTNFKGVAILPGTESEFGEELSRANDHLIAMARESGANLIVLLSREHGVAIPVRQAERRLILKPDGLVLTAIFFDWDSSSRLTEREKSVRFAIDATPSGRRRIEHKIDLQLDTAGVTKAYWTYGNISRFVRDAVTHNLDTISLRSSQDPLTENVWLPGCDQPLKVSLAHPELEVSIFKRVDAP